MAEEYRVVPYAPEHRSAVLDLHGRLLPRARSVNERYFTWKYEENPHIAEPLLALVFSGNHLVAMRGLCGTQWVARGQTSETVPAAEDLIIHPAHRNRGLFLLIDRKLVEIAAERGYSRLISLSANSATRGLQDITGWDRVAAFGGSTRQPLQVPGGLADNPVIRRWRTRGTALARRTGIEVPRPVTALSVDRALEGVEGALPSVRLSAAPNVDVFESLSPTPDALHQAHTAEFFDWRLRNPDREYRYLYWDDGGIEGYLILGLQPSNPRRVMIVDGGATDGAILLDLVNALGCATRPSLTALTSTLPSPLGDRLPRLGFVESDAAAGEPMVEVFTRTTSGTAAIQRGERWHTALIDTMLG
ncbi:MAG TPA: hypothetical protein VLG28_11325 [Acidimicrobiia bacterium]|jgi:GNAT superfamily N-acetyltransferase|nr:hypothetical protein [Acidimicrobiia bacterium]